MQSNAPLIVILLAALAICAPGKAKAESADEWTAAQEALFRANAPKFHRNFSAGEFEKNGPLVTDDVDVDSNNVKFVGRQNFIKRIERFSTAFPGLQLKDRIILLDGNVAAVNYVMQGEQKGPFGDIAPTGKKIEVMAAEIFEFNPAGQMKKLITVTELDQIKDELQGRPEITRYQSISLPPKTEVSPEVAAKIRSAAAAIDTDLDAGKLEDVGALATDDIRVNADNRVLKGRAAFAGELSRLKTPFPDLTVHDEYVLVDGNRAAVAYVVDGTQTGPFRLPDGSVLPPTGKKVHVRGVRFMTFDQQGQLDDVVIVHNENDFVTQLKQ